MKRPGTLRGRESFRRMYRSGKRFDGEVLRCFYLWERGAGTPVRAGFSVSAKTYNAVQRNRARRLMRAWYRRERDALAGAAGMAGAMLSVLFVYRGKQAAQRVRPDGGAVAHDMEAACEKIRTSAEGMRA